jgi:cytochrome c oxidase cbb3-type subunit 3
MRPLSFSGRGTLAVMLAAAAVSVQAQAPAPPAGEIVIANPNATFPAQQRALASAEVIARGDGVYQVNCQACHGGDLRGGDQGGPNLLRSEVVLNDVSGELIGQIATQGRNRMPAISLERGAIEAVAAYIHSVVARSERQGAPPRVDYDLDIVVGNAAAGKAYFDRECAQCHSVRRDLRGIGSRYSDPVDLQNAWVAGRGRVPFGSARRETAEPAPVIASVVLPDGERVEGELVRYDDFFLSLRTAAGEYRSFTRRGDSPAVRIDDPRWRHYELLAELTDDDMHDVTAYLETIE